MSKISENNAETSPISHNAMRAWVRYAVEACEVAATKAGGRSFREADTWSRLADAWANTVRAAVDVEESGPIESMQPMFSTDIHERIEAARASGKFTRPVEDTVTANPTSAYWQAPRPSPALHTNWHGKLESDDVKGFDVHSLDDADSLHAAVFMAMGALSLCWVPKPDGVFDSTIAEQIANAMLGWMRANPLSVLEFINPPPSAEPDPRDAIIAALVLQYTDGDEDDEEPHATHSMTVARKWVDRYTGKKVSLSSAMNGTRVTIQLTEPTG